MSTYSKIVETKPHLSRVVAIPPEEPKVAELHFLSKLAFETDPFDVYMDLQNNAAEIIVIDARTQQAYSQAHVPGATNLPWRKIDSSSTAGMARDKVLVTYSDGIRCNAATKAAIRLTPLGLRVKKTLDRRQGWKRWGDPV